MGETMGPGDAGSASVGDNGADDIGADDINAGDFESATFDVVVTGQSLPALLAALDFAEVGLSVAIAGGSAEMPLSGERDPDGELASFMVRIDTPATTPDRTEPKPPWLIDREGQWAPQPDPSVLGIPAVPLSQSALRLLGTGGAMRAYLDRVIPLLTIGKTKSFGELVRKRLGRKALERLVRPLIRERFGLDAEKVDVAIAAPGLNETLSRAGSLTAAALAYSDRNVARETTVEPAEGWDALAAATIKRLKFLDAKLFELSVIEIETLDDGWIASLSDTGTDPEAQRQSRIKARAVVVDHPRLVNGWSGLSKLGALRAEKPGRVRMHAIIDIYGANNSDANTDALSEAERGAVQVVGDWSVRIEPFEHGDETSNPAESDTENVEATTCRAVLSGPVTHHGESSVQQPELASLLKAVGVNAVPGAEWRTEWRAAPFATIEQRERASASLREPTNEGPRLLRVGRSLHGDDFSAALASAHSGAVDLRRHLLGLTE